MAEQYYFETFITGLLIEGGGLIKVLKRAKSTHVSLVAGSTVDSLLIIYSIYNIIIYSIYRALIPNGPKAL